MKKSQIAKDLRQFQYKLNVCTREQIDALDDDTIINGYVTCNCCGERMVSENEVIQAINESDTTDEFLNRTLNNIHDTK